MQQDTASDPWKERLSFATGTLFIWAIALLRFQPILAGTHFGFDVPVWDEPGVLGRLTPHYHLFILSVVLVGAGGAIIFLAVLHGLLVGAKFGLSNRYEHLRRSAEATASASYAAIGVLWLLAIFVIILHGLALVAAIPMIPLQRLLIWLGLPRTIAAYTSYWVISLMLLAGFLFLVLFSHWKISRSSVGQNVERVFEKDKSIGRRLLRTVLLAAAPFAVSYHVALVTTYRFDVQVEDDVLSRSNEHGLVAHISLGGAISAGRDLSGTLRSDESSAEKELQFNQVAPGTWLVHVPLVDLSPGFYSIELKYPRFNLRLAHPYVSDTIERKRRFLVTD